VLSINFKQFKFQSQIKHATQKKLENLEHWKPFLNQT